MFNSKYLSHNKIDASCKINFENKIKNLKDSSIGKGVTIMPNVIIYKANKIGSNCFIGHNTIIRENNIIKNDVKIGSNVEIAFNVKIGKNSKIHSNCFICENAIIGNNVFIAPNVTFLNSKYPNRMDSKKKLKAPIIENNVVIGGGATLLPGVTIRSGSIIGGGAVVTKNVPKNTIFYEKKIFVMKKND